MTHSNDDTEYQAKLAELREWRESDPVLWAVLRGWGGIRNIAIAAGEDVPTTLTKLNYYVDHHWLKHSTSFIYFIDPEGPMAVDLLPLKEFSQQLDIATVLEYPMGNVEEGNMARGVKKALQLRSAEVKDRLKFLKENRVAYILTEAQKNNLDALRDMFIEEVEVSPGEYEDDVKTFTRDGYKKAKKQAGLTYNKSMYLDNELRALVNKNMIEVVEMPVKGTHYAFTQYGVEYRHEALLPEERAARMGNKVVKRGPRADTPRKRDGSVENPMIWLLSKRGPMTTGQIAEARGLTRSAVHKQMTRHLDAARVSREVLSDGSSRWFLK